MNTVNKEEIQNFSKDSDHWWDEQGPFKPLHLLNPTRLGYFRDQICEHFNLDHDSSAPYKGLDIIDVGCGGGLVCEPMARLGGNVTGVDADANAIEVATAHAAQSNLEINYLNTTSDELSSLSPSSPQSSPPPSGDLSRQDQMPAQGGHDGVKKYDVVLALEIIEHVDNPELFVKSVLNLCKPDGLVIFSTLNRTPKSYALGIIAAEHILNWVPKGTHSWKKFVKPSELSRMLRNNNAKASDICGLIYSPITKEFKLDKSRVDVNYFMSVRV